MEHPIQGLMKTAMESLRTMIDVNTIIGDPIQTPDGHVIIPVSKVGFGFAAGGSEFTGLIHQHVAGDNAECDVTVPADQRRYPFGGGSGGGVSVSPMGFIVVGDSGIRFLPVDGSNSIYDRLLEVVPQFVEKWMKKEKDKSQKSQGYTEYDSSL